MITIQGVVVTTISDTKVELGSRTVYPLSLDVPLPFVCAMLISLSGS